MVLNNIFSNKKLKEENCPSIIVDVREKNSLVPSELVRFGCKMSFQTLQVGDYIVGSNVVERKTLADCKSSIVNGRIFEQLKNSKGIEKYCLIIEGWENSSPYKGYIHENSFRGFILSAVCDLRIPLIFTLNESDTAKYLMLLGKNKLSSSHNVRFSKNKMSDLKQCEFILQGFPMVGPVSAISLLKSFHSLKNIFNATEDELFNVLGKKAKRMADLIKYSI